MLSKMVKLKLLLPTLYNKSAGNDIIKEYDSGGDKTLSITAYKNEYLSFFVGDENANVFLDADRIAVGKKPWAETEKFYIRP